MRAMMQIQEGMRQLQANGMGLEGGLRAGGPGGGGSDPRREVWGPAEPAPRYGFLRPAGEHPGASHGGRKRERGRGNAPLLWPGTLIRSSMVQGPPRIM